MQGLPDTWSPAPLNGDWSQLHDVVRATVVVDSVDEVSPTLEKLQTEMEKRGWSVAVRPDNRFAKPTPVGYRDFKLNLRAPDGQICELQINTKAMFAAKELEGHDLYKEYRTLYGDMRNGTAPRTAENVRRLKLLGEEQERVYNEAWKESQRG